MASINAFLASGQNLFGDPKWDDESEDFARVLDKAWNTSSFQPSNILIVARGWGTCEAISSGGNEYACHWASTTDGKSKGVIHQRGTGYVVACTKHSLEGIAFQATADPPVNLI